MSPSMAELLAAWRAAERAWEGADGPEEVRVRAAEVVSAYAAYQAAALPVDGGEFVMVADDDHVYVAVTPGIEPVLGYAPTELLGRRIDDLADPALREPAQDLWRAFLVEGRQDGRFRLVAKDGSLVPLRYVARAHHPVAGYHLSRLWRDDDAIGSRTPR